MLLPYKERDLDLTTTLKGAVNTTCRLPKLVSISFEGEPDQADGTKVKPLVGTRLLELTQRPCTPPEAMHLQPGSFLPTPVTAKGQRDSPWCGRGSRVAEWIFIASCQLLGSATGS